VDELWDGGEQFVLGGRTIRALSRSNRFLHACYHAALGDWPLRLGSLRDVAEMLPAADGDARAILRRATAWGAEAVVAAAVSDTRRLLGITTTGELSSWAEQYVPSRREEAWLALHTQADKTFAALALATLRVLPRWRDKAAYVRALALPDARYTAGRHASAPGRFRYALREARRGRGARR
ncbi:MAG: nucleotidyltransferase family protein, partial [Pseudonocardiaceae bacterium]